MGLFCGEGALWFLTKLSKGTILSVETYSLVFNWKVKHTEIKLDFFPSICKTKVEFKLKWQQREKVFTGLQPSLISSVCFPVFVVILCFSWISRDRFQLEERISIARISSRKLPCDNHNVSTDQIFYFLLMTVVEQQNIIHFGKHENQQSNNVWVWV